MGGTEPAGAGGRACDIQGGSRLASKRRVGYHPGVRAEAGAAGCTHSQTEAAMSNPEPRKVVIIGSGPAAWTAAIYAARANLDPLVFEGEPSREMIPGGQLMWTTDIENYPGFPEAVGGQELMDRMKQQALHHGAEAVMENIEAVDFSTYPFRLKPGYTDEMRALSVIVASGARANWLGLHNEERLARTGGGVSACAVCDGALPAFRNARLAVVGGGDSAMEESVYLSKYGSEVFIIHRRDSFRASKIMADRVLSNPKIRVLWNREVVDVLGDDFVTGLQLRDTVTGETSMLEVGGLFVAIGHTPNSAFLEGQIELHASGYAKVSPGRTCTSVPGVFAAGDVMDDYYRQAVTAAGTGCMAALEAERWLAHQGVEHAVSPVLETAEAQPPGDILQASG
jgi:thioredoxin reductase (NADPH)